MALRTEQEHLDGLRDGRAVHYQGSRVDSDTAGALRYVRRCPPDPDGPGGH